MKGCMKFKGIKGEFKIYPGYAYAVSPDGRILNVRTQRVRKTLPNSKSGYHMIILLADGGYKGLYIHRMVAELFVPNPNGYRYVTHINGNRGDNRAENLEWISDAEFKSRFKNKKHNE